MNKQVSLFALAAVTLCATASVPVFADEARHDEHRANREARKAADARVDSAVDRAEGHPIRAKVDAARARHEEHRAVRHDVDAAHER